MLSDNILPDNFVTFTLNTDGIPVFKSSGYSFWPLYLTLNELPYKLRYCTEYMLYIIIYDAVLYNVDMPKIIAF